MQASDYAEFRAFAAIVRHGTFTRAAAHLGLSPSALSQTIRNLEGRLGVRLLNRTTRSVSPTEAGARLAERLLPILDDFAALAAMAAAPDGAPWGQLRINASRHAARHILAPIVGPFLMAFPAVVLELDVEDALVDIVAAGFDAGVRLGEKLEGDMIAVRLGGDLRMIVVGAPDYLEGQGVPQHPADLERHRCIGMRLPTDRSPYRWEFARGGEEVRVTVTGPLVCTEAHLRLEAAAAGLGLTYAFEHDAAPWLAQGRLTAVLEDWTPPFPGCFLYYPGRRHISAALRAFIDFARDRIPASPPLAT